VLAHAEFLTRGEGIEPITEEQQVGRVAFLVLRVVDLLAPGARESIQMAGYQVAATRPFLDELGIENDEVSSLRMLLDAAVDGLRTAQSWKTWNPLLAFSVTLQDHERWAEVADVLETAWRLVDPAWSEEDVLSVAQRLGEHYDRTERQAEAVRLYRAAAALVTDRGRLWLRLARVRLARGAAPARAEASARRLGVVAASRGETGLAALAELEVARALLAQRRAEPAATHAWRARASLTHPVDRGDALFVVGAAFEQLGALQAAARTYWTPALGHPRPTVRWQLLAALIRVLARMGDRVGFERWRRVGEELRGRQPSPSYELEFVLEQATALARFGERGAARRVLGEAGALMQRIGTLAPRPRLRAVEVAIAAEAAAPEPPAAAGHADGRAVTALWIVERTGSRRFPFRVSIEQGGRLVAAFRVQAPWPGPGQQVFCLRERELDAAEALEEVERVSVAHLARVGRKLTVALDRPNRKRCEFLVVRKERRDGSGAYEQVFFRTQSGIRAHRSRTHVELGVHNAPLHIVVDSAERYPWRFPGTVVQRRQLAVGDYALLDGERVAAVVERKSFDNLLTDVGAIQALHLQLADLASHDRAALVIEAQYRDFLDPARLRGRWPPAHLARVLGEIAALHPGLPVVFAGNRKLANIWTERFFRAVAAGAASPALELPLAVAVRYDAMPRGPGLDVLVREAILREIPSPFRFAQLAEGFPGVPAARLRRIVAQLKREGRIEREGAGRAARWTRADGPQRG